MFRPDIQKQFLPHEPIYERLHGLLNLRMFQAKRRHRFLDESFLEACWTKANFMSFDRTIYLRGVFGACFSEVHDL